MSKELWNLRDCTVSRSFDCLTVKVSMHNGQKLKSLDSDQQLKSLLEAVERASGLSAGDLKQLLQRLADLLDQ